MIKTIGGFVCLATPVQIKSQVTSNQLEVIVDGNKKVDISLVANACSFITLGAMYGEVLSSSGTTLENILSIIGQYLPLRNY